MNKRKFSLGKSSVLMIFFIFYNCVSTSKYESLQKEKEKNEVTAHEQITEYQEKIRVLSEEIELLKEECQPKLNEIKKKPNYESEKIRKIKELKRKR